MIARGGTRHRFVAPAGPGGELPEEEFRQRAVVGYHLAT
jgi:hypothetical protein